MQVGVNTERQLTRVQEEYSKRHTENPHPRVKPAVFSGNDLHHCEDHEIKLFRRFETQEEEDVSPCTCYTHKNLTSEFTPCEHVQTSL